MSRYLFNNVPTIHRKRNSFDLSFRHFTSLNVGDLAPVYVQEVYPGDDFKIDSAFISRVSTALLRPIMDTLYLDQMFFYVPSRLVYDKFKNVMGESEGPWAPSKTYSVPCVPFSAEDDIVISGSVADYMGMPTGVHLSGLKISLLPFRAFALIYNDWFRDQNTSQPMYVHTGEAVAPERFGGSLWSPNNYTGMLPKVNKFHDYFTSALPSPQKGDPVSLPLGASAPVVMSGDVPIKVSSGHLLNGNVSVGSTPLFASRSSTGDPFTISNGLNENQAYPVELSGTLSGDVSALSADLSGATAADVNDLRTATQLQRMLERDARGGTRYIEMIRSAFGVDSGDYRLQRPEFLGGRRVPLQIQQVPQTTGAGTVTEGETLGSLGAYSLSFGAAKARKGFVEHGFIIGVACIRQKHTYQQGVEKFWNRSDRTDFYDPVFANLGEQPIKISEIYAANVEKDSIFGYQEAWADLRQRPNRVSGALRSSSNSRFDIWHLADNFGSAPVLNPAFLAETPLNLDRVLAVPSTTDNSPQFVVEFDFKVQAVRCLPKYSVPGLLDHN